MEEKKRKNSHIRQPRPIDWEKARKLFRAGSNITQTAAFMQIDRQYFYERCQLDNNIHLSDFMRAARATGDSLLTTKMFEKAMSGDNTMLVWLSKNRMGYSDKQDITTDGKALNQMKIEVTSKEAGEAMQKLIEKVSNNETDERTNEEC